MKVNFGMDLLNFHINCITIVVILLITGVYIVLGAMNKAIFIAPNTKHYEDGIIQNSIN